MQDKTLICVGNFTESGCGKTFIFTVSEQKYFADKKLAEPKRCPVCRRLRKARLTGGGDPEVNDFVNPPQGWKAEDRRRDQERQERGRVNY